MKTAKSKNCSPSKDTAKKLAEKWWVVGSAEICDFFSISPQTLSNWVKKGCPQEGYGKYDLQQIINWKYLDTDQSAEARKVRADADWKEAKAGQEAIKLAVAEGKYIATEDVTKDLRRLFTVLKKTLLSIGHSLATELNGFGPEVALAAKKVIDDAIYSALAQLSKEGIADKK